MKPLEKFLKKQTTALTRAGGFVGGVADKAGGGTGASRRRASLSRVVPFFRETSPESGQPREYLIVINLTVEFTKTSRISCVCSRWRSGAVCESELCACVSVETLLDDFMLTHPIFLTADRFQQVLLQQYPPPALKGAVHSCRAAVYTCVCIFIHMYVYIHICVCVYIYIHIYVCTYTHGGEEKNSDEEKESRKKQVRPLFRHFRRIDACLQPREAFRGSDEIFCRVYTPDHSYVTIRSRLSCRVGEILALVREKLQYSEDQPVLPGNLVLVAVTSAGEKVVFRPSDEAVFTTLGVNTHLFACEPTELDSLLPLPEEIHWTPGDSKLHDMSAEEVANQLVAFDWELFSCVHEVEFVCYVFHGEQSRWRPLNLELVLQRCSEVQHWVATEILQCQSLPKRVQLLRKFIKIAALCKQHQDLLSFLAVVLGLDNPALSRLRLTWEGLPGKFRKQFQQFESVADPSRNHKSYRDLITSLRPPLIPFTPLLLKDLTFLHESCKTFHGELVNFEKMHKVADMVRIIRRYRSTLDTETTPPHLQTKAYVRQLQVIDNQNLLFDMSCRLEPKDT
uniref:Rap guanine nucleotide exchange factor like 1 n=1 Tax=Cyclopterus lumpus TaxID=8103 RepID=A0A8C2W9Y9_CYCLU